MTPALAPAACSAASWQVAPDLGWRLLLIGGLLLLAGWALAQRFFPGRRAFVGLFGAAVWWVVAATAEQSSADAACKATLALAAWPAILALPPLWALFLARYTLNRTDPPHAGSLLAGGLPAAVLAGLALANGWHGLLYGAGTHLGAPQLGLPRMQYAFGPLFYVNAAWCYGWLLAALALVLQAWRDGHRNDRRWPVFLAVMAVPWVANAAFVGFGWRLMGADPTPLGFAAALVGMGWLVLCHELFRLVPMAERLLFAELPDPVLVIDGDGRVVGVNRAARELAGAGADAIGRPLPSLPRLGAPLAQALADPSRRGPLMLDDPARVLELRRRSLGGPRRQVGELLQLRDVTEHHRAQVRLVQALADRNAQLHTVASLQSELREQALRDPLTGLHNRRALQQQFDDAARHARTHRQPLALALLDIDHFKRINDEVGHAAGDAVLCALGARLRGAMHHGEAAYRLGGEEFALLLPGADAVMALARLHTLRASLTTAPLEGAPGPVTFSAGVAVLGDEDAALGGLLRRADAAMYRAKAGGRDRVELAA
jgi:diguanylate cyclase (GGDEF)-like protein